VYEGIGARYTGVGAGEVIVDAVDKEEDNADVEQKCEVLAGQQEENSQIEKRHSGPEADSYIRLYPTLQLREKRRVQFIYRIHHSHRLDVPY